MKMIQFWDKKPADMRAVAVGYFGKYSSMKRGQRVAVLAEACGGFFKVAPVNKRNQAVGAARCVKRSNLAPVQIDFFMVA
jgi:hypothetical protein